MATDLEEEKESAARAAAQEVRAGMTLALGTGTTAAHVIRFLGDRFGESNDLTCVATSRATEQLARSLHLKVRALQAGDRFDLMLDGADEVTPELALTKGGGG